MRFFLGFFRMIISVILTFVLAIVLMTYGIVSPIGNYVSDDNIKTVVEDTVDALGDEIVENPESELAQSINNGAAQLGLSAQQASDLLKSDDVKECVSDIVCSVYAVAEGKSDAVEYPSLDEMSEIVKNHPNELAAPLGIENVEEASIDEIKEAIAPYYSNIITFCDDFVQSLMNTGEAEPNQENVEP